MTVWNDSPRLTPPPQTEDISVILNYVKNLANTVAKMAKDLEFILNGNVAFDNIRTNGIEAKNIKAESITTEKLQANSISADKIQAGAITADKIQVGAVEAEKIDVRELSAISADLGHITAGLIDAIQIFGSYIATSRNYPRCVMDSTTNEIASYSNSSKYISMLPGFGGNPLLYMVSGGRNASLGSNEIGTALSSDLDIIIESRIGDVTIKCGQGKSIDVDDFYHFVDQSTNSSLQQKLDELSDRISSLGG